MGIYLIKKLGDYVKNNEAIAILYSSKPISSDIKQIFLYNNYVIHKINIDSLIKNKYMCLFIK